MGPSWFKRKRIFPWFQQLRRPKRSLLALVFNLNELEFLILSMTHGQKIGISEIRRKSLQIRTETSGRTYMTHVTWVMAPSQWLWSQLVQLWSNQKLKKTFLYVRPEVSVRNWRDFFLFPKFRFSAFFGFLSFYVQRLGFIAQNYFILFFCFELNFDFYMRS